MDAMQTRTFEETSAAILALFPPFSKTEARVALTLYQLLVKGNPVSSESLASAARISFAEAERMLSVWPGVYRDAGGRVIGYGGLTITETKHRIRFDDDARYTWCAWDTLFIPHLLGRTAQVESACSATGKPVLLTVHAHGVEPTTDPLFISLMAPDAAKAGADIVRHFCCQVQFLSGERAGIQWVAKHPGTLLATLDQAWQLGRRHNAQRYPVRRI
jgi:alkylmercury lyase